MESTEIRKLVALEGAHWWYRERRALLARQVRDLTPGTVLDIGAAGGGNTLVLTGMGWAACAVEYTLEGAVVAAERGLPVLQADATHLPAADGSVDLVTALDVLEHLEDDTAAVGEIRRVLRPGGHLVVTVPVDPHLWSAHDEAVGHVRRYTRRGLLGLLTGAGFEIEHARSWMVLLRPVVALRRRQSTGSDLSELPAWLNTALTGVVRAERLLPVGQLPGVSLVVRARLPATDPETAGR